MKYDDWKLETPETPEKECSYCGEECQKEFCSKECRKAYLADA